VTRPTFRCALPKVRAFWAVPLIAGLMAALLTSPALASAKTDMPGALASIQKRDELVQSIGWKLITGNAQHCANPRPAIGLLLQDVASFSKPDAVRQAMGLSGDIAVQARAAKSPAHLAGLPVHAEVLAIGEQQMRDLPPVGKERWRRLADLHRQLDETLTVSGSVMIEWRGQDAAANTATLVGITACPSRFEVIADSKRASANGKRVAIGEDFVGFTYPEELLAAAIAHELAHNLLGHPAWLDKNGRKQRNIRATEREADRLMPWLLANGGYDPSAAERFMQEWGPGNDGGLFRGRTHDGWDERAEFIAAELPPIRRSVAQNGTANWPQYFQRDIQPAASAPSPIE